MKKILLLGIVLIGLGGCVNNLEKGRAAEKEKNYQDAEKFYSKSCNSNNGEACFYLAEMYRYGKGVNKNTSRAAELYQKGCNEEEGRACTQLGGLFISALDFFEAVRHFQKGCDLEDPVGCAMIASSYEDGLGGLKRDKNKAKEYMKKACILSKGTLHKDQCK